MIEKEGRVIKDIISSKQLLFLIVIVIISGCGRRKCLKYGIKNDWNKLGLHGKVKKIIIQKYKYHPQLEQNKTSNDKPVESSVELVRFNKNGFEYVDGKKNVYGIKSSYFYKYKLNKSNKIKGIYRSFNSKKDSIMYYYSDECMVDSVHKYYANGNLKYRSIYSYKDGIVKRKKVISYAEEGYKRNIVHINYNKSGQKTEQKSRYANGFFGYDWRYTYNKKGKVKTIKRYGSFGKVERKDSFNYNKENNVITSNHVYFENHLSYQLKYKYKYDNNGNWVSKVASKNDLKTSLIKRKITYYN